MALATLTISCFLFYATSKYFPEEGNRFKQGNKKGMLLVASGLSLVALFLFTFTYDFTTSFVFWLVAFMTVLSSIILSLKLNYKWMWVWGGLCIFFILIDLV